MLSDIAHSEVLLGHVIYAHSPDPGLFLVRLGIPLSVTFVYTMLATSIFWEQL